MKKLFLFLAAVVMTVPVLADDLQPVSVDKAVAQYVSLWKSKNIDPSNHEVWKLYIYGSLIPNNNYNHEKEIYITGLTPKPGYFVYLSINQLYNFLSPVPKKGDVIAVEGRITNHFYSTLEGPVKTSRIPVLFMYLENAEKLPAESFGTASSPKTSATP